MTQDPLAALRAQLATGNLVGSATPPHRLARGGRAAAVLALFGQGDHGLALTFVERARTLRKHPGQIGLPGGAIDPTDADAAAAALREADEEIGLDTDSVEVIGSLRPLHVAVSGFDVTTVVAHWRTPHLVGVMDPAEVGAVHSLTVAELADPAHRFTATTAGGHRSPAFAVDDLFIWGLTGYIVDALIELGGWAVPWDSARSTPVPQRFLRD